jgi:hypothetical protein
MSGPEYTIRRQILKIFGAAFHIYGAEGNLIGYCKQKAFKLKEDIRIYTDESLSTEMLFIGARAILDISAAYDVTDSLRQTRIGTLQRRGLKSILRDEWVVIDEAGQVVGTLREDNQLLALVRRFVANILPQSYHIVDGQGREFAQLRTHFNPFVHRMTVNVEDDCPIEPLLVLAAGVLLMAVEGRQE